MPNRPRRELTSAAPRTVALAALLTATVLLAGCGARANSTELQVSREALGTIVSVTAFSDQPEADLSAPIDRAFAAMTASEKVLSAYPDLAASLRRPNSHRSREVTSVVQFNLDPGYWHLMPPEVAAVLDRVEALGVEQYFSPGMLRVIGLYDFDGQHTVPDPAELKVFVAAARAFETSAAADGLEARFGPSDVPNTLPEYRYASHPRPLYGLDLSGAAKGAGLDAAVAAMLDDAGTPGGAAPTSAILSAGSTTLVFGRKPVGNKPEPWRIGIENPRDPEKIIGVVEYSLPAVAAGSTSALRIGTVSTSGDYQQSFVRDGVRYHHILDPVTGLPARDMRSLTVVGAATGLDSDILSTALFVMGVERAEAYAREHGLGLFIVDSKGAIRIVPGPKDAPWKITRSNQE